MKVWHSVMTASSVFLKDGVLGTWHTALLIIIIVVIIINVSLKYITTLHRVKVYMKIALIIYNYYIKPNETLDIYIVKLPSCIETLFH